MEVNLSLIHILTFAQAALGATIEVPTLDGKVSFHIPPGTQNNAVFRLKEKGIPHLRGKGRGDHKIKVRAVSYTHLLCGDPFGYRFYVGSEVNENA